MQKKKQEPLSVNIEALNDVKKERIHRPSALITNPCKATDSS